MSSSNLEMYFNPDDIYIGIAELKDKKDIWGIAISRGPRLERHPYKLLFTSEKMTDLTKEKALSVVEDLLRGTKKFGDELFTTKDKNLLLIQGLMCCGFKSKEEYVKESAPVLEDADIERIMKELKDEKEKKKFTSATYEWKEWKERYPKKAA